MKNISLKNIITSAALIFGLSTTIAMSQNATEPWTGAIPGDTINLAYFDNLKQIRTLLNDGKANKAVVFATQHINSIETESRSGKTTEHRYDAYNALCLALTAQKNYDDAKEACNTAIKASPNRWMAYNSRGSLYLKMGNFSDSSNDYRMAMENAPSSGSFKTILEHNMELAQNKVSSN
ncbi:MAG: tetratricopeptide repeat protein [Emcibacteraceae bacterium]|nr:tetratricopeptide repeat protein [Emcibacteraceae bacterium]